MRARRLLFPCASVVFLIAVPFVAFVFWTSQPSTVELPWMRWAFLASAAMLLLMLRPTLGVVVIDERGVRVRVVSLERICPIDYDELIPEISGRVLFVEEGIEAGGIGQQCLFSLFQRGACERAELAAVKGRFVPHGTTQQMLSLCGLDAAGIEARAQELLQQGEEHE